MKLLAAESAGGESRLAGIEMALLTLRLTEHWRESAGDYSSATILLAVVAISAERLTRTQLDEELRSLEEPLPRHQMTTCNISSIAAATGFNRETTRRYVNRLIERNVLERTPDGAIAFVPGYMQQTEIAALLQMQLDVFCRTANDLLRLGAIVASPASAQL